jgi:hypothetical protein
VKARLVRSDREWSIPVELKQSYEAFDFMLLHDHLLPGDLLVLEVSRPSVLQAAISVPAEKWYAAYFNHTCAVVSLLKACPDCSTEASHPVSVPVVREFDPVVERHCKACGSVWPQSAAPRWEDAA